MLHIRYNRTLLQGVLLLLTACFLSACASSFLDQEPAGGMVREDQYSKRKNTLEASMCGIYASLYAYSGHDSFGERSIDLYGDILCGDIALTANNYGWFYCDEIGDSNTDRTDYLWGYYYGLLHRINLVLTQVKNPEESVADGYCYAQALTMRSYVLMRLLHFYCLTTEQVLHESPYTWENYPTFPIYTEKTVDTDNLGYSHMKDTYEMLETDLQTAIRLFDKYAEACPRNNKLVVDATVARAMLAYSYLNKADSYADISSPMYETPYKEALRYAKEVIATGAYTMLTNSEVCTTGFNNVNNNSWIWGQEVTPETASNLGSFFGQVDIHTYSYAWAGDTKACDKNLYDAIPSWDLRKQWFNDGKKNSTFYLCPDRKFFSAKNPVSTKAEDVDRGYTSDNVYMRIEMMNLIAAEAAARLGLLDESRSFLFALTDNRVNLSGSAEQLADYASWKASLTSASALLDAIGLNWRVELWGEGYGLQTFRRLTREMRRGSNHMKNAGAVERSSSATYRIIIPSNEFIYNPKL